MQQMDILKSIDDNETAWMIVTFLFVLRIILRYRYGAPSLPQSMPLWQKYSAKLGHYGLYLSLIHI